MVKVIGICLGLFLLVELTGWLIVPARYRNPPPVTADAWIHSDALGGTDTLWLKEFVDEFCRSYTARWTSYIYFRREPFSGRHINVDSAGRRSTPQFAGDGDDGQRIPAVFLLGGSTMWGTGARDSSTIPSALARLIASNPGARQVRVVNMGESGYVSTQSLLALELELRRGNVPDGVIFYDGINDIFAAYQNNEAGLPQNEQNRATEFNLLQSDGRMMELGIHDLWKKTVTAGIVGAARDLILGPPPEPAPPSQHRLAADVVRFYRGNLEILDALSKHYGFRYRAYWQPVVFSKRDPSSYEQRQSDKMEHVRQLYLEVYRRVAADSTLRANPSFRNLSGIFDGIGPVYLDFCHVTERANGIIAGQIYRDLCRR
jgi:lysophospholipase L1-like esterase